MTVRRLGLFGGTFDPPHFGHVAALRAAARTGRYDLIEVTVAGDPYQKTNHGPLRGAAQRLAMARAAFGELEFVEISEREIHRRGPSYTIDTVRELLAEVDAVDVIVGADLASQIDSWHDARDLRNLVRVGVVPRPGGSLTMAPGWRGYEIPMEPVDLSSSFIRELDPKSEMLRNLIPDAVIPLFERFAE